jgi:hypothetical protein
VYSNFTVEIVRGCVSLKKEKSQGKAVDVTVNSKEEKPFVWISSKNLASGDEGSRPGKLPIINFVLCVISRQTLEMGWGGGVRRFWRG